MVGVNSVSQFKCQLFHLEFAPVLDCLTTIVQSYKYQSYLTSLLLFNILNCQNDTWRYYDAEQNTRCADNSLSGIRRRTYG